MDIEYYASAMKKNGRYLEGYKVVSIEEAINLCMNNTDIKIVIGTYGSKYFKEIKQNIIKFFPSNISIDWSYCLYDAIHLLDKISQKQYYLEKHVTESSKMLTYLLNNKHQVDINSFAPRKKKRIISIDEAYRELEKEVPQAYAIWKDLFENGLRNYREAPDNNLAINQHGPEQAFADYINMYVSEGGECTGYRMRTRT